MPTAASTPDTTDLLRQKLDQLPKGLIGYDDVDSATVGVTFYFKASVVAATGPEASEIITDVQESNPPPNSSFQTETIYVSEELKVELEGDKDYFEIIPKSNAIQPIGSTAATVWWWQVRPLRAGKNKELILSVQTIVRRPDTGQQATRNENPQTITLSINVNPGYTIRTIFTDYGWLLFLSLVTSAGSYVYLRSRNRHTVTVSAPGSRGLSADLYERLRLTLLRCDPFAGDADLRTLFTDARIAPWRNDIPQANTPATRVRAVVDYLYNRCSTNGENALVLLLHVLADNTDPADALHSRLLALAADLDHTLTIKPSA